MGYNAIATKEEIMQFVDTSTGMEYLIITLSKISQKEEQKQIILFICGMHKSKTET